MAEQAGYAKERAFVPMTDGFSNMMDIKIWSRVKGLTRDFLDLIFPIECLSCSAEGEWLCAHCFRKIAIAERYRCFACGKETSFGRVCSDCRPNFDLAGVWQAADYEQELLAGLIKTFKYKFVKDLDQVLAKVLIRFLKNIFSRATEAQAPKILSNISEIIIMPVPLHPKRLRWRGFNQAALLARPAAAHFNLRINETSLARNKNTAPQTKFNGQERKNNVSLCFSLAGGPEVIKDKYIILIDDVITTGSTLNECAKVLKQNGAKEVWGLAVAKG